MDNSSILFADFIKEAKEESGPIKYYAIERSPVCVARSLIIYEMLKQGSPAEHAFEVWYLSCISEDCTDSLNQAIKSILAADATDPEIEEVLTHWL